MRIRPRFACCLASVLAFVAIFGARADEERKEKLCEVDVERDIAYYDGPGADAVRHKLDVYTPRGRRDFPVVMFVHGGAWVFGDKDFFGVHAAMGRMFARHGIGAVLPNYRLSPGVQHPEHVKDVARAFAWMKRNMPKRGGRADALFVCGHSAGGHLAALLATDESYLKGEGLKLRDIRGAMPISGVFNIPPGMFQQVFGNDAKGRKLASPLHQAHAGCPPFLILYGDKDFPFCDVGSKQFAAALVGKGVDATARGFSPRTHFTMITDTARDNDPAARALLDFVGKHSGR